MKNLSIILLNGSLLNDNDTVEIINYKQEDITNTIKNANGEFITFVKNPENLVPNYIDILLEKTKYSFDVCFINYTVEINGITCSKELLDAPEVQKKPYVGDYIWSYIWKKEKLIEVIESKDKSQEAIDKIFYYVNYIREPIYHHIPSNQRLINNFIYVDEKDEVYEKNIIYMGTFCNGKFNGYISWLNNIGRCFAEEYDITILYDKIYEPTKKEFEKHFKLIQRNEHTNYICDRLIVTYSTYYYPKNILFTEENYLFIHGNMSDYPKTRTYTYDNYTRYLGVSEISAKKAEGFFPTKTIDYILNPIKLDIKNIKPHLKLVSAQRNDPIKRPERLQIIARILDEEEIPYTWNLFTNAKENDIRISGGLILRDPVQDPLPYIQDADYYVQLSDSEAYCYSVVEALTLGTKVIITPLECYKELDITNENSFTINFELFNPENKEELRKIIKEIYKEKERKITYELEQSKFNKFHELFKK